MVEAADMADWEQMKTVPLESCLEEARSNDSTEELGKLADGKAVELPVRRWRIMLRLVRQRRREVLI